MKRILYHILVFLIVFLFAYTAVSKLVNFQSYVSDLHSQPFPAWLNYFLIPFIPIAEISCVVLLCFPHSRKRGLWVSLVLICLFCFYTLMALTNVFERVPCPCGGIIKYLSWKEHLVFTIAFLIITVICLWIEKGQTYSCMEQGKPKTCRKE